MVNLTVVREQYQRMPDEELLRFAVNEADKLSIDAFHSVKAEFEARKLDIGILEEVKSSEELSAATKVSEFERETAIQFAENVWQFAFDEKANGKTNNDIFKSLLKKNISEKYAYMLIENLEPKARNLVDSFDTDLIVGWVFLIAGLGLLIFTLNSEPLASFLIWGTILCAGGFIRLMTSYKHKSKFEKILRNIEAEKEADSHLYQ